MQACSKYNKKLEKKVIKPDGSIKVFEDIGISTKTVIAITNMIIDLDLLYTYIPIVDFIPQEKKRGRKKRINIETPVHKLPFGSIIMIQKRKDFRGTILKTKSKKSNTFFLHSVTIIISLDDNKFINVKISTNGKLQITGCKEDKHCEQVVLGIFKNLMLVTEYTGKSCFSFINNETSLRTVFNTVMQNMDFNIGFAICRNKLDSFINQQTNFRSIFEGSINTEVNIKIPLKESTNINYLLQIKYNHETNEIVKENVPYTLYCNLLNEKERKKETRKERNHTFLVFASGSIIMSSRGSDMSRVFYDFINILILNRKQFEDISDIDGPKKKKNKEVVAI